MLDMRSLEIFFWVVELRSFSRTAEHLGTSQPAVSQRLAAMEQRVGHELLLRPTRNCLPSEYGRLVYQYAEQFMRLRARMESELARGPNVRRTVSLGVSETIVHTWLSKFIEGIHSEMPNLTIDITVDISPRMHQALQAKEIDLAFMLGPSGDPGCASLPLNAYPLSFVAHPDLVPEEWRTDIDHVAGFPIITYPRETYPFTTVKEVIAKIIMRPPRIFANASLSTMVKMARDRIGVALIPTEIVRAELADGDLVRLGVEIGLKPLEFVACYIHALDDALLHDLALRAQICSSEYKSSL
ncbi:MULTISPECIES: LysR family transcriptional regulator [unclassified Aureimonas]|uniref:LysR family transcriptional regulator n=1 Tax=unclassified Aureimonas TaxID=2615206 RepID=UPI0006FDF4D9|nr:MULTISPECIES: LysR family transcriptional regulator [unclassified Aureimonas]KQT62918.1 hypothetical protein ASG62_22675 [Aureimonas sp. Leaf427]KQT74844.1 hypothetical protein ASG54_16495 [Aureimonas sp. Leaf460]